MSSPSANRGWKFALALLLATGVAAAAAICISPVWEQARRNAWRASIVSAAPADRPMVLRQLCEREGELSQSILVELLGHHNDEVVQAVQIALHETLNDWRSLSPEESAERVAHLAGALAQRAGEYPPAGQAAAAALSREMLYWPIGSDDVHVVAVLDHCESILLSTESSAVPPAFGPPAADRTARSSRR